MSRHKLPSLFLAFFRWYCHPSIRDYIEGDLGEVYARRLRTQSKRKADLLFMSDVLLLFRPGIIKPAGSFMKSTNHSMIKSYITLGLRSLNKRKGVAIINIAGLSLSFASCILIYLFVTHHLQYDNFHTDADRIYRFVTEEHRDIVDYDASVPPGFANAFRADYPYAEKLAKIVTREDWVIAIGENKKIKGDVAFTENEFFEIFNFPLAGNATSLPLREANTAFVTQRTAKKMFGDSDPVGQVFQLDGQEWVTVTGVLQDPPPTTLFNAEIFISFETLKAYDDFLYGEDWGGINSGLQCFARLFPGSDINEIETAIFGYVKKFRPTSKNVHHYKLQPLSNIHFDPRYSGGINPSMLWIFSLIGLFLLVVAGINFVNISTALSVNRSKEVGVRKVLGSQRNSLFWQFMTETLMIIVVALLFGFIVTVTALPYFNTMFSMSLSVSAFYTPQFIMFTLGVLLIMALLSGSYPGIILARIAPLLALKGKLTPGDIGGVTTRKLLVVTQFVISIMLLIGMIGVNKQLDYAIHSNLGFDQQDIVMVSLPSELTPSRRQALKNTIAQIPGVEKISICFASPGAGDSNWGTSVRFDNKQENEEFSIRAKIADIDYLETFDLQLLAGRNFLDKDSVDEILVNAVFAQKVGLDSPEELLGKSLSISGGFIKGTIVGVVNDFHDGDFRQSINPIFIAPVETAYNELGIKINRAQIHSSLKEIEEQWSVVFPDFIFEYDFLDTRVAELYQSEQRFLSLTRLFSGITLLIGCLGIYGLILFFVAQKTREIGIRKVLGGSIGHILVLVSQDFLKLLIVGALIATPLAWYFLEQWLQSYEYKTPISWWIFVLATVIVAIVTLLTISYQALKAALANPVKSLRTE
jgi:ABC-type antimicrobial peptide transport system permease subunit